MIDEIVRSNQLIDDEIKNLKEQIWSLKKGKKCEHCGSEHYYSLGLCRNCYARLRRNGTCEYLIKKERAEKTPQQLPWKLALACDVVQEPFKCPDDFEESVDFILDSLPERVQKVIHMRYEKSMTLSEIGIEFGVTKERIGQIKRKGIRMLRHSTRKQYIVLGIAEVERKKAEKEKEESSNINDFLEKYGGKSITELDLDVRSYNALMRGSITTISLLYNAIRQESLLYVPNLGKISKRNIVQAFERYANDIAFCSGLERRRDNEQLR